MNWFRQTAAAAKTRFLRKRPVGSIHQRFADLFWLASKSCGTTHAGDIKAVNLKTLDFSPLSEFLLGTAELLVIKSASDPRALAAAWHRLPDERLDFVSGRQRLEVKSSSNRLRVHHFSLVQLTPLQNSQLIVASLSVEPVGAGLSLRRLFDEIRSFTASEPVLQMQLEDVFYATLGANWNDGMEESFDEELASESLQFFDSADIPKIDGPISPAISDIRFTSDMSAAPPVTPESLRSAGGLFTAVVPAE